MFRIITRNHLGKSISPKIFVNLCTTSARFQTDSNNELDQTVKEKVSKEGKKNFTSPIVTVSKIQSEMKERKRGITPIGKLDQVAVEQTSEPGVPDPYAPFPDGKNPFTGEMGGPRGPEPTRYGDWERKGRVTDF